MFHHIVLMQFTAEADRVFRDRVEDFCGRMRRSTPCMDRYIFRRNEATRSDGLDWAIVSSFNSRADHDAYQISSLHQEMKSYMSPFIARIVACDIDEDQP